MSGSLVDRLKLFNKSKFRKYLHLLCVAIAILPSVYDLSIIYKQFWFWTDILEKWKKKISMKRQKKVAAFRGMHVSPAKQSYVWLPRKCDYRTDRRTESDPYVPLCIAGDTTMTICFIKNFHKSKACLPYKYATSLRRLQSCLYTSQSTWEHRCVNVSSYEKKTYIP